MRRALGVRPPPGSGAGPDRPSGHPVWNPHVHQKLVARRPADSIDGRSGPSRPIISGLAGLVIEATAGLYDGDGIMQRSVLRPRLEGEGSGPDQVDVRQVRVAGPYGAHVLLQEELAEGVAVRLPGPARLGEGLDRLHAVREGEVGQRPQVGLGQDEGAHGKLRFLRVMFRRAGSGGRRRGSPRRARRAWSLADPGRAAPRRASDR